MTRFLILISLFFLTKLAFAQKTDPRLNGLDTEIVNLIKTYNTVGLSVTVVEKNKIIYSKGFGFRDYQNKLPATPDTIFPIGSITKSFTASLLGILENKNLLSINNKPSLYIPKFKFYNDRMDNLITISDLLCHKSGLGNLDGSYILFPAENREKLIERLKYLKPNGEINNSWIYSNMGYIITGAIIEKITNESWESNIQNKLFNNLGMNSSNLSIFDMIKTKNYSFGYGISNNKIQKVLFAELNNDKPGGSINSTTTDMAKWMITWLNNGSFQNKEILPKSYIQEAMSIKAIDNGSPPDIGDPNVYTFGYGYGWKINSSKGHYKVHHGGNISGFSSQLAMYPTDNLGIVVLTNQHNSILPYIIADIIANRILLLKRTEWNKYPVKIDTINTINTEIKNINTSKKPTHDLTDYCGKYSNPGFGTFEIINENNNLFAVFKNYKFRLEHQNYDIFILKATEEIPQIMNPEFYLNFSLDYDGNISTVKINLQDEPVEFKKVDK